MVMELALRDGFVVGSSGGVRATSRMGRENAPQEDEDKMQARLESPVEGFYRSLAASGTERASRISRTPIPSGRQRNTSHP